MGAVPEVRTERLLLRGWRGDDRVPFAALNADPVVMERMPSTLGREESDALVDVIEAEFEECGYGLWAVEVPGEARFAGYVGLHRATFEAGFTPAVEIGWRLDRPFWGRGYATEAARAVLRFGFEDAGLEEVVSFTSVGHARSRAVMERIGLEPVGEFDHPNLPEGHRLRRHVLYRLTREAWRTRRGG